MAVFVFAGAQLREMPCLTLPQVHGAPYVELVVYDIDDFVDALVHGYLLETGYMN
jgi:hypothetical protein